MKRALLAIAILAAAPGQAQETDRPAMRITAASGPIRVDGRLDDAAWSAAAPITEFRQFEPQEGAPVSERTEVRIVADEQALYVSARLHDRQRPTVALGRRDTDIPSDWFGIVVDSRHDHRSGYGFWVNSAGVRSDARVQDGVPSDRSWDAVWDAAALVDSAGWSVEMRIPLSQLRFQPGSAEWGLQINRFLKRREEDALWAFTPSTERGGPSRYGHLQGVETLRTGPRLEAAPYTVARSERVERGANPFRADEEYGASMGLDLKYRLTGTLTLDATLNPDFGTVEQDPSQVNLTAFELELPERRPFFVEGAEVFEFGRGATGAGALNRRLVYPRRIGRRPQIGGPAGSDRPEASTILGAAKLTGLLPGGWTVGALNAVTQEERLRWMDSTGPRDGVAEPLTNYFAGRLMREWRGGASWLGVMGTSVTRRLDDDSAEKLRGSATVLGVDFSHDWANRAWRISGYAAGSRVAGSPEAILRAQTASSRYLQRPDAAHLEVDSAATSLSGWSGQLQLTRQSGRHWLGDAWVSATSAGYEVNDLGFAVRSDVRQVGGRVIYRETAPGRLFRRFSITPLVRADFNGAGDRLFSLGWVGTEWTTLSYWRLIVNAAVIPAGMDDRSTRGGPIMRMPGDLRFYTEFASDPRRPVTLGGAMFVRRGEAGSDLQAWTRVAVRPSPRWSVSLRPELYLYRNHGHFVTRVDDPTATETFGRRYLFADLRQTTASLEARLDYTFTPDLSLQLFARPYVSAGEVTGYKELARPGTYDWNVYGEGQGTVRPLGDGRFALDADGDGPARETVVGDDLGESDFVVRTLRGSAVLRWEWRPGSTLYLAWQQARDDEDRTRGAFSPRRDSRELFGRAPDNVFVVKLSYWLNR